MDSFGSHYQPREETDCFVFADTAPYRPHTQLSGTYNSWFPYSRFWISLEITLSD